ncbi:MAG TPA: thioredoxin domain-containing protein, partial [Syntrophorhabdales bacterium]|nr:thioredoxin domain-containing protein [Syntrophorhabdales bacterium]
IIFYYTVCGQSCAYLKGGIFPFGKGYPGINLTYLGLVFAGLLFIAALLKWETIHLLLLSAAVGTEGYLVAFQVRQGVYCPYCLFFGGVLLTLFALNFRVSRKLLVAASIVLGFLFFWLFFQGATRPVLADTVLMPSFGNGKVKVRIYTDYFCGPCSHLEPQLEGVLAHLVSKNLANITFIDTPIHPPTPTYARYFLYILNEKPDFDYVLRIRAVLFGAAKNNITEKEKLEEYLLKNQIRFRQFDTKPTFTALQRYLDEDGINSTPTVVIYNGQNKGVYKGAPEILKALEQLK